MSREFGPAITGIGVGLPRQVVTNDNLAQRGVNTTDEWIRSHTGIRERRIADPSEATSDFALTAAHLALDRANLEPRNIDEIVVATVTPDQVFPSVACMVQDGLGAPHTSAFDLAAACTGAIYGLRHAYAMTRAGEAHTSLVIGAETLSRITDWGNRETCVLFGDGAGAVVVQNVEDPGVSAFVTRADGSKGGLLNLPAGGSRLPASEETVRQGLHTIQMDGKGVYKHAVTRMAEVADEALQRAGLTHADGKLDLNAIDHVIPHQANLRIMEAVMKRLGVPSERLVSCIDRFGNTSAASILIATNDAYERGSINRGDTLLMVGFGGGFTYGAGVLQWHMESPSRSSG